MKGRYERYQRGTMNSIRLFSLFGPKFFSSITRFLEFVQVKGRLQRYQHDALNRMRTFFSLQKIFLRYLDFWGSQR